MYNKGRAFKLATEFSWNLSIISHIVVIVQVTLKFSFVCFSIIHWVSFLVGVKELTGS
jgi:hypothetical protein